MWAVYLTIAAAIGTNISVPAFAFPLMGCAGWKVETVASGLEQLENLEPDGEGGFYLAGETKIYRIENSGHVHVVAENLAAPGGLQRDGSVLYVLTRNDGKLWRLNPINRQFSPLADFPGNGLLRLPEGDFLTTWVGIERGSPQGVSRYDYDTGKVTANWAPVPRGEGLALSPDHRTVYTDDLITGQVYRIPLDAPDRWTVAATVPGLLAGPDDLTMSANGDLYVAAHLAGAIYRVNPVSGTSCRIDVTLPAGWLGPSSARIAAYDGESALYVTSFDGTLRRLRPPADAGLGPIRDP